MDNLTHLKIGRRCYKIHERELDKTQYGELDFNTSSINVADDLTDEEMAYTLIHEALHGIWDQKKLPARPTEERGVIELAWGLTHLFRDNPGFLSHLEKLLQEAR